MTTIIIIYAVIDSEVSKTSVMWRDVQKVYELA
jgi:hypothetical protein